MSEWSMLMMLRRRMLHDDEKSEIKYPLIDGTYPQYSNRNYEIQNGVIHLSACEARFCLATPTIPFSVECVNNESWIIHACSTILFEIDNTCGLRWFFRTTGNTNVRLDTLANKEFVLESDVKNIFSIYIATEGEVNIKLYVDGERWI